MEKIEPFQKTAEVVKYEFTARASQDYILIRGRAGKLFGEHWHAGTVASKSPETIILVGGQAALYCRHVKTGEEQHGVVVGPAVIKFYPFWYHEMKAVTDVTIIEFGSLAEHQADRRI